MWMNNVHHWDGGQTACVKIMYEHSYQRRRYFSNSFKDENVNHLVESLVSPPVIEPATSWFFCIMFWSG